MLTEILKGLIAMDGDDSSRGWNRLSDVAHPTKDQEEDTISAN